MRGSASPSDCLLRIGAGSGFPPAPRTGRLRPADGRPPVRRHRASGQNNSPGRPVRPRQPGHPSRRVAGAGKRRREGSRAGSFQRPERFVTSKTPIRANTGRRNNAAPIKKRWSGADESSCAPWRSGVSPPDSTSIRVCPRTISVPGWRAKTSSCPASLSAGHRSSTSRKLTKSPWTSSRPRLRAAAWLVLRKSVTGDRENWLTRDGGRPTDLRLLREWIKRGRGEGAS